MEEEIKIYLRKKLASKKQFTTVELRTLLCHIKPNIGKSAYGWWINKLKNNGFFTQLSRGIYTFQPKDEYIPSLSHKAKQFYNRVNQLLPEGMPLLIYESSAFMNIIGEEPKKQYIFMHIPREQLEIFFYDIINLGKRVFIKPSPEVIQRYILPFEEAVILYPFFNGMPLININGYITLPIEGLLVHTITNGKAYFQSREIEIIKFFQAAFKQFNVNVYKMLRYAARREKRDQVMALLKEIGEPFV